MKRVGTLPCIGIASRFEPFWIANPMHVVKKNADERLPPVKSEYICYLGEMDLAQSAKKEAVAPARTGVRRLLTEGL